MRTNMWDTNITSFVCAELEQNPFDPNSYKFVDAFAKQMSKKYLTNSSASKIMIPRSCLLRFYQGLSKDKIKEIEDYLCTFSARTIPFQKTFPLIQNIINTLYVGNSNHTISELNAISLFIYSNYLDRNPEEIGLTSQEVDELVIDLIGRQLRKIKFSASEYILYRKFLEQVQTEGITDYRSAKQEIIGDSYYFSTNAFEEIVKSQRFDITAKRRRLERLITAADIATSEERFNCEVLDPLLNKTISIDREDSLNHANETVQVWEDKLEAKSKKLIKTRT